MAYCTSPTDPRRWMLLPGLIALAMASLQAQAEPTPRSQPPDPLDTRASVPALAYKSSLKLDPRPAADGPVSWREANDTVTRIGGWRVYAKEANPPAPPTVPAPKADTPVPRAQPHLHGGHQPTSGPKP